MLAMYHYEETVMRWDNANLPCKTREDCQLPKPANDNFLFCTQQVVMWSFQVRHSHPAGEEVCSRVTWPPCGQTHVWPVSKALGWQAFAGVLRMRPPLPRPLLEKGRVCHHWPQFKGHRKVAMLPLQVTTTYHTNREYLAGKLVVLLFSKSAWLLLLKDVFSFAWNITTTSYFL